jgi:ATP-dependent Lhr-like helicase
MYGLARPAEYWEREYLPSRVENYDAEVLSRLIAAGEMVWIGGATASKPGEAGNLATIRFLRRGTARAWISTAEAPPLSEHATRVLGVLEREGASFFDELLAGSTLTSRNLRDALRELVGAGLVTNDTIESLRLVVRWRPLLSPRTLNMSTWRPIDSSILASGARLSLDSALSRNTAPTRWLKASGWRNA